MDNTELLQQIIIALGEQNEAFEKMINERAIETETRLSGELAKLTIKLELLTAKVEQLEQKLNNK